jgi:aspartate/methionine/tyrosine aminotransferase
MTGPLPKPSRLAESVAPFIVMDVMAAAERIERKGGSVIHMEVGQPSAPTPASICRAAARVLERGHVGYTQALGNHSLRERIAQYYTERHGVTVSPERIVVTTGSSGGFVLSFLACFERGARVAISAPGYPAYRNILVALGLEPVEIAVDAASNYVITGELIRKAHRETPLAGVLVMSPANPTGVVMSREQLADVSETCQALGLWFISDEVYHGLTYEKAEHTALSLSEEVIVASSFSKYYCMTGWRVGWLVLPERMVRIVERLQQNMSICVPHLSQVAAEAAFSAVDECEAIKRGYAQNRAFLLKALPQIGIDQFFPVDGAFYIYADIGRYTNDTMAFCKRVLEEVQVAITPGLDFDAARGGRMIRMSFAGTLSECEEGVGRLDKILKALR